MWVLGTKLVLILVQWKLHYLPQQSSLIFVQPEMGSYNSDSYFSDLGLIQEFGVP